LTRIGGGVYHFSTVDLPRNDQTTSGNWLSKYINSMNKWHKLTKNRFSLPHPDLKTMSPLLDFQGRFYYECFKNSSQQYRDEIFDIYFGKVFHTEFQGKEISYGNVMGVESSDEAIDWLFRIQDDFGTEISLTMNQLNVPLEMYSREVTNTFVEWLRGFYDRGLRSCTIGNAHIMNSGILQRNFPDMRWKNTVNQMVMNTQMVADIIEMGYTFIQLNRSLNRDMDELKKIKKYVDDYNKRYGSNIITCLLVYETCLPFCPFKREHDDIQTLIGGLHYWKWLGGSTCNRWREHPEYKALPRTGTDCVWNRRETFEEYANLVDVFKYSGRLSTIYPEDIVLDGGVVPGWCYGVNPDFTGGEFATGVEGNKNINNISAEQQLLIGSFADILEQNLEPLRAWTTYWWNGKNAKIPQNLGRFPELVKGHFFTTDDYNELEEVLKNCKNRCYSCHMCEKVYRVPPIDSLINVLPDGRSKV